MNQAVAVLVCASSVPFFVTPFEFFDWYNCVFFQHTIPLRIWTLRSHIISGPTESLFAADAAGMH